MDRNNIDKIAKSGDDRILLAKLWDKIQTGMRKNIPSNTAFLAPREQEMARYLFGDADGLYFWGGYAKAERKMLVYLPEYLTEDALYEEDSPLCCIHAEFYDGDTLSHRDFLGALMGAGIARETVGDILVSKGYCDFLVTSEIAPYVLQNLTGAGRTKIRLKQIPLHDLQLPVAATTQIKDTLASLRLDNVISSGFRISRTQASQAIVSGKVAIDGLPCEKPDKPVEENCKISLRGMGKIKLTTINGQTKKGRISVVIDRYV